MKSMMKKLGVVVLAVLLAVGVVITPAGVPKVKAAKKAEYSYKKVDNSLTVKVKEQKIVYTNYYKRVVLKGKSKAVKKINKFLKEKSDKFIKETKMNSKEMRQEVEREDGNAADGGATVDSEVTYNDKGVISIRISTYSRSLSGIGFGYSDEFGYTFSLKTGKLLTIKEVATKSLSKIKKELIKKSANTQLDVDISEMKESDFKFFLKKGNKLIVVLPVEYLYKEYTLKCSKYK